MIDLTVEDDEDLSRALKASLQDQGPTFGPGTLFTASLQDQGPTFGPSERAPDPNWAMVPSNVILQYACEVAFVETLTGGSWPFD